MCIGGMCKALLIFKNMYNWKSNSKRAMNSSDDTSDQESRAGNIGLIRTMHDLEAQWTEDERLRNKTQPQVSLGRPSTH